MSGAPLGSVSGGGRRSREDGLRHGCSGAPSWNPVFARCVFQRRRQPRWCLSASVFRAGLGISSIQRRPSVRLRCRCLSVRPATQSRRQPLSHGLRPSQVSAETWPFQRRCAIGPSGAYQCAGCHCLLSGEDCVFCPVSLIGVPWTAGHQAVVARTRTDRGASFLIFPNELLRLKLSLGG